jgi:hypothetical protein
MLEKLRMKGVMIQGGMYKCILEQDILGGFTSMFQRKSF